MELEVENKGKPSFPSNYVTIHQLRQRWLQQQQQQQSSSSSSSSFSLPTVIPESIHRDEDDDDVVEPSSATTSKKPQNHTVSGHSPPPLPPPPVTKSPSSFNTKNKASSSPPFSPILSGGSKKKPQNDAVSPPPPAKTKSSPPLISKQNRHYEIISKTLNESRFGKGRGPNRRLVPQKPETEPETEPIDGVEAATTLDADSANDVTDQPISNNQLSKKKKRVKKKKKPKRVSPDQSLTGTGSLPETDPKPELEVEAVAVAVDKEQESGEMGGRRKSNKKAVRESKMGPELEQAVVVEKNQRPRETRGRRNWDRKGRREFKDKTGAFDRNDHGVGENAVEAEAEPELEVEVEVEAVVVEKGEASGELGGGRKSNEKAERESKMAPEPEEVAAVVVEKKQKPRESRGRRDWDKKAVWEYKPKTASFGQYDYNSNVANNVDDVVVVGGGGVGVIKDVVVDKVVGNGDVVKENPKPDSGNLDHQGQGRGKQSLKPASFDMSETAVKESDAVNNYNYNRNATGNGGRNWRMGHGRFRGHGMQRPMHSKPLIATRKGEVWVKKGESNTTYHLGRVPIAREDKADS